MFCVLPLILACILCSCKGERAVVPADRDVPLVGEGDGDEDGGAEGDVVERVDDEGEEVHEEATAEAEGPEREVEEE